MKLTVENVISSLITEESKGDKDLIEKIKDSFKVGEWSIYHSVYKNGELRSQKYLLGLKNKSEAEKVVNLLNRAKEGKLF